MSSFIEVSGCNKPRNPRADARNAVFYGDKAIDRSPCGTGSSTRMAQLVGKNRLFVGDSFVHESIIGTMFDCRVEAAARVGNCAAIKPSVAGWARVTGHNTIYVDDRDPLAHASRLSDRFRAGFPAAYRSGCASRARLTRACHPRSAGCITPAEPG